MSNQYMPQIVTQKVYIHVPLQSGTKDVEHASGKCVNKYINYQKWEQYDSDSTLYHNVVLLTSLEEKTYNESIMEFAKNEKRGTDNVIMRYKSKNVPMSLKTRVLEIKELEREELEKEKKGISLLNSLKILSNIVNNSPSSLQIPTTTVTPATTTQTTPVVNVVQSNDQSSQAYKKNVEEYANMLRVMHGISYEEALVRARTSLQPKFSDVNPTAIKNNTINEILTTSIELDYIEIQKVKTIGPFNVGATFDRMAYNNLTGDGILLRNKSTKCYTITFDRFNSNNLPKLMYENTTDMVPDYFNIKKQ
jgi:hypothetical protein